MDPATLATHLLLPPNGLSSQTTQLAHRQHILTVLTRLGLPIVSQNRALTVLELGCGQGDQTAALLATPPSDIKFIMAIDPGDADYGSPFTLGEAQRHLASGELAFSYDEQGKKVERVKFLRHDALSFFRDETLREWRAENPIGVALLSHSLWYFPSVKAVLDTFTVLKEQGVTRLAVAEWALQIEASVAAAAIAAGASAAAAGAVPSSSSASSSSSPASAPLNPLASLPHLLAILAQNLIPIKANDERNVRLPLSPATLTALAVQAGWRLVGEEILPGPEGMKDGTWEVYAAQDMGRGDVATDVHVASEALGVAIGNVGGVKGVGCMDVWCAVFE